jgi:hypothetical protein
VKGKQAQKTAESAGFLMISKKSRRFSQKKEIPRPYGQGIGN